MSLFGRNKFTLIKVKKKNIPEGIWSKCPDCGAANYVKGLKDNLNICPNCDYHYSLNAHERLETLLDKGTFEEFDPGMRSVDPLEFKGPKTYPEKIREDQEKTGLTDAIFTGRGKINGQPVVIAVTDSRFIMGSMGSVVGEKIARAVEYATRERLAVVIVSGSGGGARMYEGVFSLMQMAKTCSALARHHDAGLLYISVLTDPTMGGIIASFAGIGDVIIAEPKALIGFAGPRVVEQTIRQKLPQGFQRSEFLLAHGLIDMIVERKNLTDTIARIISFTQNRNV